MYELQTEADTGGVGGRVTLAAVEQHLGDPDLVLVHVSWKNKIHFSINLFSFVGTYLHSVCMWRKV